MTLDVSSEHKSNVTVAFDIGNVLCFFDMEKFTQALADTANISIDDASFFAEHLQKFQDVGLLSMRQALRNSYGSILNKTQIDNLIDVWNNTVVPSETMLNFLDTLRAEDVKIALLSNMGQDHITHLRENHPRLFNKAYQHISCEVGARKPTKQFFQSFLTDHDEFKGSVYLDDIEENLKMGKRYSFKVYCFNLNDLNQMKLSQQKQELDRVKQMIFDKI